MSQSQEETDAYARMESAIEDYLRALDMPGLLLDWVLVAHKIEALEDGSNAASTHLTGAEHQTQYRTLGLLEYGVSVIKAEIEDSLRGDDDR